MKTIAITVEQIDRTTGEVWRTFRFFAASTAERDAKLERIRRAYLPAATRITVNDPNGGA